MQLCSCAAQRRYPWSTPHVLWKCTAHLERAQSLGFWLPLFPKRGRHMYGRAHGGQPWMASRVGL